MNVSLLQTDATKTNSNSAECSNGCDSNRLCGKVAAHTRKMEEYTQWALGIKFYFWLGDAMSKDVMEVNNPKKQTDICSLNTSWIKAIKITLKLTWRWSSVEDESWHDDNQNMKLALFSYTCHQNMMVWVSSGHIKGRGELHPHQQRKVREEG